MEDIGLCDSRNIKLIPLVEFMHEGTITVATAILFLPINKDFNGNGIPIITYISLLLDFHTFSGMNCVQKSGTACNYLQFRGTHITRRQLK